MHQLLLPSTPDGYVCVKERINILVIVRTENGLVGAVQAFVTRPFGDESLPNWHAPFHGAESEVDLGRGHASEDSDVGCGESYGGLHIS